MVSHGLTVSHGKRIFLPVKSHNLTVSRGVTKISHLLGKRIFLPVKSHNLTVSRGVTKISHLLGKIIFLPVKSHNLTVSHGLTKNLTCLTALSQYLTSTVRIVRMTEIPPALGPIWSRV